MKYLVLDDEILAAEYLAALIYEVDEKAEVVTAINPVKSLELAKQKFHVCFIDIQMPGLNGIEFANELKKLYPKTNFIFVTGYSDYMGEAFRLDASDYIMKPANVEQVRHALENLRYSAPRGLAEKEKQRIQITCFGNFDILIDGKPVKFKFDKTKELLAYLVHRKGARCTSKEVIVNLWEEDGHDSYYRMLKKDLQDVLNKLGCEKIIYRERGQIGLANLEDIQCDYFKWKENTAEGRKLYHGEYMAQYSWGKEVNAFLDMDKYQE
ncbi:LytR/AlgR family response regulator transcription factor [Fusobacterium sp.]|uniref:LytR/AlgR family response regulator transcription factor n=1 Tax=Fusobacterium sp. TaxID=68766 RepID=UPI0029003641|nr:response regulator [Fusobacterium sp.]MDU1910622.1 response regulator [Fusobacterium sp.]